MLSVSKLRVRRGWSSVSSQWLRQVRISQLEFIWINRKDFRNSKVKMKGDSDTEWCNYIYNIYRSFLCVLLPTAKGELLRSTHRSQHLLNIFDTANSHSTRRPPLNGFWIDCVLKGSPSQAYKQASLPPPLSGSLSCYAPLYFHYYFFAGGRHDSYFALSLDSDGAGDDWPARGVVSPFILSSSSFPLSSSLLLFQLNIQSLRLVPYP